MIVVPKQELCNRLGVATFEETGLHQVLRYLPKVSPDGPWLAGGAVRRTLDRTPLDSDFDFFFKNEEQKNKFAEQLREEDGAFQVFENEFNATYLMPAQIIPHDEVPEWNKGVTPEAKIQLIHFRYYNSAEEVIDSFDFTLSQFAYDGENIYMADFAMWDVARRRLVPHKLTYATASVRRLLKYSAQGFTVCNGAIANILEQVADRPTIIEADVKYID